jgi:hypothetical protein
MIETIGDKLNPVAIIIRGQFPFPSGEIQFLTSPESPQQIGIMSRLAGQEVMTHFHNTSARTILSTQESIFVRKGKCEVDFFEDNGKFISSATLFSGDFVYLSRGGHGFRFNEDTELIEVKQGPYLGKNDKRIVSD